MSGRTTGRPTVARDVWPLDLPGAAVVGAAGRFAARARARRRRLVAAWVALAAALAGAGWLLLASPWGTVRTVEVHGTARIPVREVQLLAAAEVGRPLLLVDGAQVAARVRSLRLVAQVRVVRHWPGRLSIEVTERRPVAALPRSGGGFALVDRDGVEVEVATAAPARLPVVEVDLVTAGAPAVRSALDSLAVMPAALRVQVRRVGAASGDGVWFALAGGDRVVWGDAGQVQLKAAALGALQRQTLRERAALVAEGNRAAARRPVRYDVSAPRAPSVQR